MTIGNNNQLSVVLVDDEVTACINLKNILNCYVDSSINIAGIANDTREAEKLIHQCRPDAIFLDIEMPEENAFDFLERISPLTCEIIFVTAYDEYAVKAFKLNAVDYILKPLSINEVVAAVKKLKERIAYKKIFSDADISYSNLSKQINNRSAISKITLKDNNAIQIVDFNDVFFVEAKGSYSRISFFKNNMEKEIIVSHSISEYEEIFPEDLFFRIHKSYLINCKQIKKVLKDENPAVIMNNQNKLPISRRKFTALINFFKTYNIL